MDSKLSYYQKHKVTQLVPAIFADNMLTLITRHFGVPWKMIYTNEEYYEEFDLAIGFDIIIDLEDIIKPWHEADSDSPVMWHINEETFTRVLHYFKTSLWKKSIVNAKAFFLIYCESIIYLAVEYFKKGLTSALRLAFVEVYNLACYYLERTNFKSAEMPIYLPW